MVRQSQRKIESIVEEQVKAESRGKSERHFIVGRDKEHRFVRPPHTRTVSPSDRPEQLKTERQN
jgi:hypothetical protein